MRDNETLDNLAKVINLITKMVHEKKCPYVSGIVIISTILSRLEDEEVPLVIFDSVSQSHFKEKIIETLCIEHEITPHELDLVSAKVLDRFIENSLTLAKETDTEVRDYIEMFLRKLDGAIND